jgi:hypothetical protein
LGIDTAHKFYYNTKVCFLTAGGEINGQYKVCKEEDPHW